MSDVIENGTATAGDLLRDARQAAGVHIAALAVALKVPVSKIEALEANNYEALPDTVFVRALASSICRTLKLDPAPILSLLPQTKSPRLATNSAGLNAPVKGRAGKSVSSPASFSGPASRSVTLIVLALLAGALVLVFFPRPQESTGSSSTAPVVVAPVPGGAEPQAAAVPTDAVEAPGVGRASDASKPMATTRAADVAGATASQEVASTPAAAASAVVTPPGALVLRARGESWVQVRDAGGAVVLQRKLTDGETVPVAGSMPFSVVVGRADVTDVFVRGKPFDLTGLARENVARFEVK